MESRSESSTVPPPEFATVDLLTADGTVHQLRQIGTNEICLIELQLGKPFGQVMAEVGVFGEEKARMSTMRAFIKHCLVTPLDDAQVGDLIDAVGFRGIAGAINRLIVPAQAAEPPKRKPKGRPH